MKAKIARLLASALVTVTVMSGMTPCVVYAQTPDEVIEAEIEAEPEVEPEVELEAEPEVELEAEPEVELEAEPETEFEADLEAELVSEPEILGIPVEEEGDYTDYTGSEPDSEPRIVGVPVGEEPETTQFTDNEPDSEPAIAPAEEIAAPAEEIIVPVHEYSDDVVKTDIKTIQLTESKAKRIITEYTDNGWRIITTQYLQNGEVVSQSVYNQVEERLEMQEESEQAVQEIEARAQEYREEEARKAQAIRDEETAEQVITDTLNSLNPDELLEIYSAMSEGNDATFIKQLVIEVNDATSDDYGFTEADARKIITPLFKNLVSGTIKALPGADFYGDAVKGIIFGTLGLEDKKTDIQAVVDKGTDRISKELTEGFAQTQRYIDNYGTLKDYGDRLDEFTDYAAMRSDGIKEYEKNYSELEKKVRIANLIGSSDEWYTGANNGNIMKALKSATAVFKGQTNVDNRDLFNIVYDINKETSLFSGEAMAKSQGKLEKAVNGFINNCRIVLQCLKAHEEIADFTDEQIASLDSQTRAIYDRIHANKNIIAAKQRELAAIFIGDKSAEEEKDRYGLMDKAGKYYSKSKTTYVNYGSNGEGIALKDTLNITNGRDYIKEDRYTDLNKIDNAVKASGLTAEDIGKIAYHARLHGMTITEYLEAVGFNTENLNGYKYLLSNSYYFDEDTALGLWKVGPDKEGAQIYDMNNKNMMVGKENCPLTTIGVCLEYGIKIKEEVYGNSNQNVAFVTFEKE